MARDTPDAAQQLAEDKKKGFGLASLSLPPSRALQSQVAFRRLASFCASLRSTCTASLLLCLLAGGLVGPLVVFLVRLEAPARNMLHNCILPDTVTVNGGSSARAVECVREFYRV